MTTIKAGCFLINKKQKSIALVHREKQNDWSFPKGHHEDGETIKQCAVRETAEETKRDCIVLDYEPYVETYTTPKGENCVCYMFVAIDNGKSDNDSTDTHDLVWTPFDKVEETLSYPSLKTVWNFFKPAVAKILNKKED